MKKILALVGVFVGANLLASTVELTGPEREVSVGGTTVTLHDTATVLTENAAKVDVKLTGVGMRTKYGLVKVYVATSYLDGAVDPTNPMKSIESAKAKVLRLTMVSAMDGKAIKGAFQEALLVNDVDVEAPALKAVFDQFTFSVKPNDVITLVGYPLQNGDEQFLVELPGGQIIEAKAKGIATDFWKVWFGEPVDTQMDQLKEALIGKGN